MDVDISSYKTIYLMKKNTLSSSNSIISKSSLCSHSSITINIPNTNQNFLVYKNLYLVILIVNNNDINQLKQFLNKENMILKDIIFINNTVEGFEKFNLLTYAIINNTSKELIEYILEECYYELFDYGVDNLSPLICAIGEENYKIADMLIENGADINKKDSFVLKTLQDHNKLNERNLRYVLNKDLKIENVSIDSITNNEFLEMILKHYFSNSIVDLLLASRNRIPLTDADLNKNLYNSYALLFLDTKYDQALEEKDQEKLRILFTYDISEDISMKIKINKYRILTHAIELYITNNTEHTNNEFSNYFKKILGYHALTLKQIINEKHFRSLSHFNEVEPSNDPSDIHKLLINYAIDHLCRNSSGTEGDAPYDPRKINYILKVAVKVNDIKIIKYILENKKYQSSMDINVKDIEGETLIVAALEKSKIFKYLLDHGANGNAKDNRGISLLSLVINENPSLSTVLLSKDDINIHECGGNHPLVDAIKNNFFKCVMSIILYAQRHDISMTEIYDLETGYTPLILAYKLNFTDIFDYLIDIVDINEKDHNGYTILYYVLMHWDKDLYINLLNRNVDVNDVDSEGNTLVHVLIQKGKIDTLYLIKEDLIYGDTFCHKIDINKVNKHGETPLISLLKSQWSNINDDNQYTRSVSSHSHHERFKCKNDVIEYFIKQGGLLNFLDQHGRTPLDYAIRSHSLPVVRYLVEKGAKIDMGAMIEAIDSTEEIYRYLIDHHAYNQLRNSKEKIEFLKTLINEYKLYVDYFDYSTNKNKYTTLFDILINYIAEKSDKIEVYESGIIGDIIRLGKPDMIDILVHNKFDITMKDGFNKSYLYYYTKTRSANTYNTKPRNKVDSIERSQNVLLKQQKQNSY